MIIIFILGQGHYYAKAIENSMYLLLTLQNLGYSCTDDHQGAIFSQERAPLTSRKPPSSVSIIVCLFRKRLSSYKVADTVKNLDQNKKKCSFHKNFKWQPWNSLVFQDGSCTILKCFFFPVVITIYFYFSSNCWLHVDAPIQLKQF